MATLKIPVRKDLYAYTFDIELERKIYKFTFTYNKRIESWTMDVEDVLGIRVVGGTDLLKSFHHFRVPPGQLYIHDLDHLGREPNQDNFGDRIVLVYDESS